MRRVKKLQQDIEILGFWFIEKKNVNSKSKITAKKLVKNPHEIPRVSQNIPCKILENILTQFKNAYLRGSALIGAGYTRSLAQAIFRSGKNPHEPNPQHLSH